jgi:hypothetical protein
MNEPYIPTTEERSLGAEMVIRIVVVGLSGSVGLLADSIHNFADAATAIPLGVAFWLTRRGTTRRFTQSCSGEREENTLQGSYP